MVIGPVIALFIIAIVSLLIVKAGATALMMTGLSQDIARFQAYSAFFGVGFTTSEAEHVVNHPLRRRIIRHLILCGNVGLTSVLATTIITFLDVKESEALFSTLGILVGGLLVLFLLAKVGIIEHVIDKSIRRALKGMGMVHVADYDLLLRIQDGYCVSEIEVDEAFPLVGKALGESRPADAGVIVLGIIKPGGDFLGAPNRHQKIEVGDTLVLYGTETAIDSLH